MVEKNRKREKNKPKTFSEKKEKCQRATRQRLNTRNPCTRYNPFSRRQGNRRSRTTPHNERMSGSLNFETTPLIRTLQMNDITRETKRASQEKKNSEWQEPATSPTRPNPNPGRPRNRWSIELERTNLFHRYI